MVSVPDNVSCGICQNCENGFTNYCLRANRPGIAGAIYGFADGGPYPGGQAGESIVIYGAGPVGQMAALSAIVQGAAQVMIVDRHPDRLRLAREIGATTINKVSPIDAVMEQTNGLGADRGAECGPYLYRIVSKSLLSALKFAPGFSGQV